MRETIPPEALLAAQSGRPPRHRGAAPYRGARHRARRRRAGRPGWGLIGYDLMVGRRLVYFAWIWPEPVHVHLGFQRGVLMDDPGRRLQGRGITKQVRWLTFRPGDPIDPRVLAPLILEAARIAGLSRAEQMAIALDRETDPP